MAQTLPKTDSGRPGLSARKLRLVTQAQFKVAEAIRAEQERRKKRRKLHAVSLSAFTADKLQVPRKAGGREPLILNAVQEEVHALIQNQLNETGMVRTLILKARQLGISTYVAARWYWHVQRTHDLSALQMTHDKDVSRALLEMIRGFATNDPDAPARNRDNRDEMRFAKTRSLITVLTASPANVGVGRGLTKQLCHLSELPSWGKAVDHATGILETVADEPGTEIIMESTAKGMGNFWHSMCMEAMRGESEYQLIFIPFFKHTEYRREPPAGWAPPPGEWIEMRDAHDLTPQQLYWAYRKNRDMASREGLPPDLICWTFKQEYPTTIDEAFRASRAGGYIKGSVVAKAMNTILPHQSDMPLIIGCDFATGGGGVESEAKSIDDKEVGAQRDGNCFISRRGRRLGHELYDRFKELDSTRVANRLVEHIERLKPDALFFDSGGGGAQVADTLASRGYGDLIHVIDFGSKANDPKKSRNKRAEMWRDLRDLLADQGSMDIIQDDQLEADLTAVWLKDDEHGELLAPKKDIKKKHGFSPDGGDAAALTFAERVRKQRMPSFDQFRPASSIGGY